MNNVNFLQAVAWVDRLSWRERVHLVVVILRSLFWWKRGEDQPILRDSGAIVGHQSRGSALIAAMRGKATAGMTTDEILAMTRGEA